MGIILRFIWFEEHLNCFLKLHPYILVLWLLYRTSMISKFCFLGTGLKTKTRIPQRIFILICISLFNYSFHDFHGFRDFQVFDLPVNYTEFLKVSIHLRGFFQDSSRLSQYLLLKDEPSIIKIFVISKISDNNLPSSLINLFVIYAFWLDEIKLGNKFVIQFANTFEINLTEIK